MSEYKPTREEEAAYRFFLRVLIAFIVCGILLCFAAEKLGAATPPVPANWSLAGLASVTQRLVASGTALPATSTYSHGDMFQVYDTASWTIFRLNASGSWSQLVASGSGGTGGAGVTNHSELDELAFDDSGHTGFASSGAVVAAEAAIATVASDLSAHEADTTDPHGDSPTFTDSVTIGSGNATATVGNIGTATLQIEDYLRLAPQTATPTGCLDGTIWYDENTKKFRGYADGVWVDFH